MKKAIHFRMIEGRSLGYGALLAVLGAIIAAGLGATYYMEHNGHWVTGMTNKVIWGTPHVFAVFLIVAASGALNVASIASAFNRAAYKPMARLSALLAITLLVGGLAVLVLDLGRPDRLIVAMTYYNFKSIFAWNIYLYTGFMAIVGVYIWVMMDNSVRQFYKAAGIAAFIWRLALTTGTGSIFGFLVARQAYDAAIMAPMFIIMSFSFGLAIFLLVLMASMNWTGRPIGDRILNRLKNLQGVFVAAVLYFAVAYHLTNLYGTEHHGIERFILLDGGIYTQLFWIGQVLIGGIIPLVLLFSPLSRSRSIIALAAILVIIGGLAQMYVIIIGGQAYPLIMFPGMEVSSAFQDGTIAEYSPSLPEVLLGLAGVGIALAATTFALKVLPFLPASLADADVDPHHKQEAAEATAEAA
ncbi:MAG: molybdopterin oxidoreductase [Acidithiobacillales bacterium SG8_45]|jgi:Ni/Fe-hydrogenase subunit HybB-like protein|nr:MAG: molybdopterin oxidoreductase [Acidithiobacillales bacterium SG8_45]